VADLTDGVVYKASHTLEQGTSTMNGIGILLEVMRGKKVIVIELK